MRAVIVMVVGVRLNFLHFVTGFGDGFDNGGNIVRRAGIPAHGRAFVGERNGRAVNFGNGLNRFRDMTGAIIARHAFHQKNRCRPNRLANFVI